MRPLQPRLQRLLRALLACWMLLVVFEPPLAASAGGQLRTLSAWLSPVGGRPVPAPATQLASRAGLGSAGSAAASRAAFRWGASAPASRAVAERVVAQENAAQRVIAQPAVALSVRAGAAPGVDETALPRGNGRYLYLEFRSLLC